MAEKDQPLPVFPCPNCGANLLEKGFYNHCSERSTVLERNYSYVTQGRIYVDHEETNNEMDDHECDLDAYCCECDTLLSWPLYELRGLDGHKLTEVPDAIADLQKQLENRPGA